MHLKKQGGRGWSLRKPRSLTASKTGASEDSSPGHPLTDRTVFCQLHSPEKLLARAKKIPQPGSGVRPLLPGLVYRDAQRGSHVLVPETGKVTQLDDLGRNRVLSGETG